MPTRKELLASLLDEAEKLGGSLETNAEASNELRSEFDSLRSDISDANAHYQTMTDNALERLSDRLSDFRGEMSATLKEGADNIRDGLIKGHLIGSIVGGLIQKTLQERSTDPRWIMARRIYDAIRIIGGEYNAGNRLDYDSALHLLRVHEFKAEQARYVVDLLLRAGAMKEYQNDGEATFIMCDPDNEAFQTLNEGYKNNKLTYLTIGPTSGIDEEEGGN